MSAEPKIRWSISGRFLTGSVWCFSEESSEFSVDMGDTKVVDWWSTGVIWRRMKSGDTGSRRRNDEEEKFYGILKLRVAQMKMFKWFYCLFEFLFFFFSFYFILTLTFGCFGVEHLTDKISCTSSTPQMAINPSLKNRKKSVC